MTKCLSSFSAGEVDWEALADGLAARCSKWHVYCKPMLVGWYNQLRRESGGGSQLLEAPEDALAFVLYSGPGYLDTIVEQFLRTSSEDLEGHFVDGATDAFLGELRQGFNSDLCACTFNLDKGPPYFHAQTLGVVAGIAQHIEPSEVVDSEWHEAISARLLTIRSADVWGPDEKIRQKIFGVSVHPELGGWYAYRGLLILSGARAPALQKPAPLDIVSEKEKRRILEEYNLRGDECHWRDLTRSGHPSDRRYTPEEMLFFTEMNLERRRVFLQMKADILSASKGLNQTNPLAEKEGLPKVWGANPALVESLHSRT